MATVATTNRYPALADFLGAWFHPDFDLEGNVPDVVRAFRGVGTPGAAEAVAEDIRRFLADAEPDAGVAFVREFDPDVLPAGWGMTIPEWLGWVRGLLLAPEGPP